MKFSNKKTVTLLLIALPWLSMVNLAQKASATDANVEDQVTAEFSADYENHGGADKNGKIPKIPAEGSLEKRSAVTLPVAKGSETTALHLESVPNFNFGTFPFIYQGTEAGCACLEELDGSKVNPFVCVKDGRGLADLTGWKLTVQSSGFSYTKGKDKSLGVAATANIFLANDGHFDHEISRNSDGIPTVKQIKFSEISDNSITTGLSSIRYKKIPTDSDLLIMKVDQNPKGSFRNWLEFGLPTERVKPFGPSETKEKDDKILEEEDGTLNADKLNADKLKSLSIVDDNVGRTNGVILLVKNLPHPGEITATLTWKLSNTVDDRILEAHRYSKEDPYGDPKPK